MEIFNALQKIRGLTEGEFNKKLSNHEKSKNLPKDRRRLLFEIIKGRKSVDYTCSVDIERYAIQCLLPEIPSSLLHEHHLYSRGDLYEYDPPKNGCNIIKHGISFGEVVSYSKRFGTLSVACQNDKEERLVVFSDLNLDNGTYKLQLPLKGARELNYILSIAEHRRSGSGFRLISSRIMSSKEKKYRETMKQSFKNIYSSESDKDNFTNYCVEYIKKNLFY